MAAIPPKTVPSDTSKLDQHVDYRNLPLPIYFEELHREALMSLKPEVFEGARFDYNKALSPYFFISHSATMGPMEVPSRSSEIIKIPTANYEFGANYIDTKLMLIGRISHEGRLTGRVKYDLLDNITLKANGQLTSEPHMSQVMGTLDYKGTDYRAQVQFGSGALVGANYIQSVTPNLSLGAEIFYTGQHRKSGVGYAARYANDKMVATGQVANTGMVALSYAHKASEKISLATELMYNYITRDVSSSVGYDVILRQARVRGKIDSNGCVSAVVEERLTPGLGFLLSAELDHYKNDSKFGIGVIAGE